MKKIICAFATGQAIQLLILTVGERMTYTNNLLGFCIGVGAVVLIALIIGAAGSLLELAVAENERESFPATFPDSEEATLPGIFGPKAKNDMDEVPELDKRIKVTNTNVKKEVAK